MYNVCTKPSVSTNSIGSDDLLKTRPCALSATGRGAWMCHRCAASGSWYDLKRRAGSGGARLMSQAVVSKITGAQSAVAPRRTAGGESSLTVQQQRSSVFRPIPDQRRVGSYPVNLFHNPRFSEVKKYLTGTEPGQRGINEGVLIKYGVGCATYR